MTLDPRLLRSGAPPVPSPAILHGLGDDRPAQRRGRRTFALLVTVLAGVALAWMAIVLASLIRSQTGSTGLVLGTALALLPLPIVAGAFLWIDRHAPEPPGLLAFAFVWGAVVAALTSALVNTVSLTAIAQAADQNTGLTTTAVVVAPLVEEATKGLGVLLLVLTRRREFDGVVDGIVCAGFVGLGFAFSENVLYFGRAYVDSGMDSVGSGVAAAGITFVLRGLVSPFAHPLFTVLTGVGLGVAAHTRYGLVRLAAPLLGYAAAVALHAAWNLAAVSGLRGFLTGYVFFMVPVFLAAVFLVAWVSGRESGAIRRGLPAYVSAGWLPAYDVEMVASPSVRRRARAWAQQTQGRSAERSMRAYQVAAADLALLRDRVQRGRSVPAFVEREETLLLELLRARSQFQPPVR